MQSLSHKEIRKFSCRRENLYLLVFLQILTFLLFPIKAQNFHQKKKKKKKKKKKNREKLYFNEIFKNTLFLPCVYKISKNYKLVVSITSVALTLNE